MKVLLDLDGVLVNFVGGMCESHNRPDPFEEGHTDYYLEKAWDMSLSAFWKPAENAEWWANLPKTKEADDIVQLVEAYVGFDNVCILTSPTVNPLSLAGKVQWIQSNYPDYRRKFLIGPQKQFCAHPGSALIDDHEANIHAFVTEGGHGILVPRPWNTLRNESVLPSIELQLETLTNVSTINYGGRQNIDLDGILVH